MVPVELLADEAAGLEGLHELDDEEVGAVELGVLGGGTEVLLSDEDALCIRDQGRLGERNFKIYTGEILESKFGRTGQEKIGWQGTWRLLARKFQRHMC